MATLAQLRTEPWWDREVVTPAMAWLSDELCRRTGRPRTAAGAKGNTAHLRGAHRSQEWLLESRYCTDRRYTVQSGLTATQSRHVAGVDFTPGSTDVMILQCKRLMAAMRAGLLDEVRELLGNVDGDTIVDGWDNLRDRAITSDSSHLWHWHLTLDRRHADNIGLMRRIVAIVMGDDMDVTELDTAPIRNGRTLGGTLDAVAKRIYEILASLARIEQAQQQPAPVVDEATLAAALVRPEVVAAYAPVLAAAMDGRQVDLTGTISTAHVPSTDATTP